MTKNQTLVPVDVDLSEIEIDTLANAAHYRGQTVHQFMQETTRTAVAGRLPRLVFVPADSIQGWPFFKPIGQGAM